MADFERQSTAGDIVTQLMRSMGLNPPSTISSSQDPTALQFWALCNDVGRALLDMHDWQALSKDHTITTLVGVPNYPLPEDWNNYVADAAWNQTTRLPAIGSLREYEWQMLKARLMAGTTFTMMFRVQDDEVTFYETPSTPQTIVMPYCSRGWVRTATGTYRDNVQQDDDIILYDSQLFKAGLKLAWLAEKKFDTTRQQMMFDTMLDNAKGKDTPARTLTLDRRAGG